MTKNLLTTILFFITFLSFGQSFEGTITYVTDFELSEDFKKMGMTKEMILDKMTSEGSWADTIRTSYKQGNYYSALNSQAQTRVIYTAASNKIYTMQDDICTVTDASIDLEYTLKGKMPTVQKLDTTIVLNGISCSVVRVKWGMGSYDYYYNASQLKVDPTLFSKHVYDSWAQFLKLSNALPLKIVKTANGMMTVVLTSVSSKAEAIDDKLFLIPKLVQDKDFNFLKTGNSETMRIKK